MALFVTIKLMSCCAELGFSDPHATHDNRAARRAYLERHPRRLSALALLFALAFALCAATGVWFIDLSLAAIRDSRAVTTTQVCLASVPLAVGCALAASVLAEVAWQAGSAGRAWRQMKAWAPRTRGFRALSDLNDPLEGFEDARSMRELVPLGADDALPSSKISASDFNFGEDDGADADAEAMRPLPGAAVVHIAQQD
jgi:hypothetical protein